MRMKWFFIGGIAASVFWLIVLAAIGDKWITAILGG